MPRMAARVLWVALLLAVVVAVTTDIPDPYVFAPLLGAAILWAGLGFLFSLQRGGAHIPDGAPRRVDPTQERISYWCAGCGAEVLLVARGTASPPRHCGERMHERVEILRERLTDER